MLCTDIKSFLVCKLLVYESEMAPNMYKEKAAPSPKTPKSVLDHHHASNIKERPVLSPRTPNSATRHQGTQKEPRLHHLNSFKETSAQHNLPAPVTSHTLVTETKAKEEDHVSTKTLTETVTEMLTPAYHMVSDATHTIAAKFHSPVARDELGAKMMWDKGVSMKEYLLQKLEPGEEEKALSEVITEAISPRKAGQRQGGEMSVVDKVRVAVSSLLGKEEQTGTSANFNIASHSVSQRAHGTSRPLFKASNGSSILETKDIQESLIPTMNYAHGGSIPAPTYTHEASISASKDTPISSIPSDGYTHGALITETKHPHVATNPFSEDGHEALNKASEHTHEASIPASKGILSQTSKDTHDTSPSSVYIDGVSISAGGYAHVAPIAESKRVHGASLAPEHSHEISVPTYEANHGVSLHASDYAHRASIQGSQYAHGTSVLHSAHTREDSSPLPVSTNPSLVLASTNSSTISTSTSPSLSNVSTNPFSTSPQRDVEETGGRMLQAHAN